MDIRNMTMVELINSINEAENQEIKNLLIMEFTFRMYIPFQDKTFEEMLVANGYKIIEKPKRKDL